MVRKTDEFGLKRGAALAVLLLVCLAAGQVLGDTFWWMENEEKATQIEPVVGDNEIREPFFAFIVSLAEGDSLGTWTAEVIRERLATYERDSRFPIELVLSLTRRPAEGQEQESRMKNSVGRIWEMELAEDLDGPMPYSILGYHPGSLQVSKKLVFSEWNLGQVNILLPVDEAEQQVVPLDKVMIMRLDEGHIVLDVDAWLDVILGKGLDDSWTLGLALARNHDIPMGLAISIGRKKQNIFGEIDFLADKVKAHGSPAARALSRHGRIFTAPYPGLINQPWPEEN